MGAPAVVPVQSVSAGMMDAYSVPVIRLPETAQKAYRPNLCFSSGDMSSVRGGAEVSAHARQASPAEMRSRFPVLR
jgi:hypothetical protein